MDCAAVFHEGSGGEKYDGGVGVPSGRHMFGNSDLKEGFPAVEGGGVVAVGPGRMGG